MGETETISEKAGRQANHERSSGLSFLLTRVVWLGFLLLVFSLSFVSLQIYIKSQRIAATDILFVAVSGLWFVGLLLGYFKFRWHRFYWLLIFYFAAMFFSTIFSPEFQTSAVKLSGGAYLIGLAVLTFNLVRDEKDFKRVILAWLAGTCVTAAIAAVSILLFYVEPQTSLLRYTLDDFGAVPVGNYPRLQSTFVSASMFCNYLTVSLALLFVAERAKLIGKVLFSFLYFLIALCAFFTISSSLGGFLLFVGIWYWFVFRDSNKLAARVSLAGAIAAAICFCVLNSIALAPYSSAPYSFSLPLFDVVLYPSPRILVWTEALKTFAGNFFFGNGLGLPVCRVLFQNTDGTVSLLTDAHNTYLSAAAQNGIFGLLSLTAIAIYFLRNSFRLKTARDLPSTAYSALSLAFLSAFVFQGLTGSFEDTRHLWVLMGLLLCVGRLSNTETNPSANGSRAVRITREASER